MSGVDPKFEGEAGRIVTSEDGKASVWVGAVDDLWSLGKPRGVGGPWLETKVKAGELSDPYLMTGYDRKSIELRHDADGERAFEIQVDVAGTGLWLPWKTAKVGPGETWKAEFPGGFGAYWLRAKSIGECEVSLQLEYR